MAAMSIERLSKAATAAGYVMVPQDEPPAEFVAPLALPAPKEEIAWRVVESKLRPVGQQTQQTATGWLRNAFGQFGRGATA
jgi:hypothetical protein